MKRVPFRANHSDALHCMLATYGMLVEHFTSEKLSWTELEKLSDFKDGKPAWSMKAYLEMAKLGIKVKMMDSFDYQAYLEKGLDYYKEFLTPEEYGWQLEHADLPDKTLIPEFLKLIDWKRKSATLSDIDEMLRDDMLVSVGLNLSILNEKTGFEGHMVLVLESAGNQYIAHDPGPPPKAYRKVDKALLYRAMGGDDHNNEVTGFYKA